MDITKIKNEILEELSKGNQKPYKELRNLVNWIYRQQNPLKKKSWNRSYYEKVKETTNNIKKTTEPKKEVKKTTEIVKDTTELIKKTTDTELIQNKKTTEIIPKEIKKTTGGLDIFN